MRVWFHALVCDCAYVSVDKNRKNSVLRTILSSILAAFVQVLPPRAARIALNYGQISLITATVNHLETSVADKGFSNACVLIGATAFIHIVMVVSYSYRLSNLFYYQC
jgi:hypothetical protein